MQIDLGEFYHKEETEELEYKEGFDKDDFAQTVAAFSTHKGGLILIGVKDNGEPVGYRKPLKFEELLQDIAKNIDGIASITIETANHTPEMPIIAVKVLEGSRKPYGWKGAFYTRKGKNDYKLSSEEIFRIKLKALNLTFDNLGGNVYGRTACLTDLEEKKVIEYLELIKINKRQKIHDFKDLKHSLKNLDLLVENGYQPKNSALLFFSKNTQAAFPSAIINFLVYKKDEISEDYKLREFIGGTLIEQLERAFELIKQYTENKIIIEGLKRIEITQYPLLAVREALINAIAHRDYSINDSEIVIRIFKNRIEISNPGGLLEGIILDELKKGGLPSKRRNPLICQLFDDLGFMEKSGHGISNMINEMKKMGLKDPIIEANSNSFKIIFEGHKIDGSVISSQVASVKDLEIVLNERQKKAVKYIQTLQSTEGISATEFKKKFKVHLLTAISDLTLLEKLGVVKNKKIGRSRKYFPIS